MDKESCASSSSSFGGHGLTVEGSVRTPHKFVHRVLGLSCRQPQNFVRSQWPCSQWVYILYSIFWALYIPAWAILEGVVNFHFKFKSEQWRQATYFIYLTNWTYLILSVVSILRAIAVCWYFRVSRRTDLKGEGPFKGGKMPIFFKIIWVLYNITLPGQVMVGAAYYLHAIVFGAMDRTTPLTDPMNIHIHGIATIYVICDLFISATPMKPGHVIHVFFYAITYASFSGIYFVCGGKNKSGHPGIYRLLDWSHPRTVLFVALATGVATPLVWFILYGFYRVRIVIHHKCFRKEGRYFLQPKRTQRTVSQETDTTTLHRDRGTTLSLRDEVTSNLA